jgi:hypothetical protein
MPAMKSGGSRWRLRAGVVLARGRLGRDQFEPARQVGLAERQRRRHPPGLVVPACPDCSWWVEMVTIALPQFLDVLATPGQQLA